ncbi:hypothetical protein GCM10023313_12700 [Mucilaginibacter defluvii]|uniref:Uncharacterized protein n=1 Tax=Mucilaginibacter defluvii TaxID=1196019 RepID=A0ABP9FNZ9_9SPHI
MVSSAIAISICSIKELVKNNPIFNILKLLAISIVIGLISELAFQVIRYFTSSLDIKTCIRSAIVMTLFYGLIAFLTAFQFKTRKTSILWIMITSLIIIANIAIKHFKR